MLACSAHLCCHVVELCNQRIDTAYSFDIIALANGIFDIRIQTMRVKCSFLENQLAATIQRRCLGNRKATSNADNRLGSLSLNNCSHCIFDHEAQLPVLNVAKLSLYALCCLYRAVPECIPRIDEPSVIQYRRK